MKQKLTFTKRFEKNEESQGRIQHNTRYDKIHYNKSVYYHLFPNLYVVLVENTLKKCIAVIK